MQVRPAVRVHRGRGDRRRPADRRQGPEFPTAASQRGLVFVVVFVEVEAAEQLELVVAESAGPPVQSVQERQQGQGSLLKTGLKDATTQTLFFD